ncbi:MAG: HlyD family efflux transporter periplasmic adaptor subunit [Bacteroidales bacterium]
MKRTFIYLIIISSLATSCGNSKEFDATGNFESTEIIVSSEVIGKLITLNVNEGDLVKQDSVIGYVDSTQLFFQKERIIKSIDAVGAKMSDIPLQTASIKQQIKNLEIERHRAENLVNKNVGNQKQLDEINYQIEVLNKQLAAGVNTMSKANISISKERESLLSQIEVLNDQLSKTKIKSPISGTIITKYIQAGELLTIGKPIFKIADINEMILRVYLSADVMTKVKIGQNVKVFVDFGDESKEYVGVISWISPKAEFTPKTIQTKDERENLVYAAKVIVKNDGFIKIGMFGEIQI